MIVIGDTYYDVKPMCLTSLDLKMLYGFGMKKSKNIVKLIKVPMKRKPYKWLEMLGDDINDPRSWGFEADDYFCMLWHDIPFDYKNNCVRIRPHFGEIDNICWVRETFHKCNDLIYYDLEYKAAVKFLNNCTRKSSTHMKLEYSRSLIKVCDIDVVNLSNIWFYKVKIKLFATKVNGTWNLEGN